MNTKNINWLAPAPLWKELTKADLTAFNTPVILGFKSDTFMQEFMQELENNQSTGISKFKAKPETWQGSTDKLLKLYQPAHKRHYLVAASLICKIPGLPDREIDLSRKEQVSFVIRKFIPDLDKTSSQKISTEKKEYALVLNSNGYSWTLVQEGENSSAEVLIPGEETLPMFTVSYKEQNGYRRSLFAGTIPVGKWEIYENSVINQPQDSQTNENSETKKTALRMFLHSQVVSPWRNLIESTAAVKSSIVTPSSLFGNSLDQQQLNDVTTKNNALKESVRDQIQTGSWYILLDLAIFIKNNLPDLFTAIENKNAGNFSTTEEQDLYDLLFDTKYIGTTSSKQNLMEALNAIVDPRNAVSTETRTMDELEEDLEKVSEVYPTVSSEHPWPKFFYLFADPEYGELVPAVSVNPTPDQNRLDVIFEEFLDIFEAALIKTGATDMESEIPLAAQLSNQGKIADDESEYIIRCVYLRPECFPGKTEFISKPTEKFQMAGFFDPDAPARPIKITLPVDPTPAGLRKYAKNTAFMMSDALCGQMSAIRKVTFADLVLSVLPWPFHKDLPIDTGNIKPCGSTNNPQGRVCSLSIPIVTICALFLLIMIVLILDYVFKWVPWLISCFPLPNFASKK